MEWQNCFFQCFGAGAAKRCRSRKEMPEPQRNAAPAPMIPATKPMLNIDKFWKNVTNCSSYILFLFILTTIAIMENHEQKSPNSIVNLCFKKKLDCYMVG
jgi:hypothetical protein